MDQFAALELGPFDIIHSTYALPFSTDPAALIKSCADHLKPGGTLLIRDLFRPDTVARLEELVGLHASDATAYQRKLFGDSLHAALTPGELRAVAQEAGITGVEVTIDTDRHMSLQRTAG